MNSDWQLQDLTFLFYPEKPRKLFYDKSTHDLALMEKGDEK
jgi:hypothetical protein